MTTTMEEANAMLKAAVAERLASTPADDPKMVGYERNTCEDSLQENYAEWEPPTYARQTGDGVLGQAAAGTTAKFGTGAVRSDTFEEFRYDLVSPIGLREVARACAEGAAKYGDWNWEKGMPVHDLLNHAIAHIYGFLSGDRSEPHLGHAAWNLLAAIHSYELWPQLNDGHMRGDRCCAPAETEGRP